MVRTQQGVTLLETLVAMAVMTVMISWFIPSMQQWHAGRLVDAQMRDVQALMQQAQMASLDHGHPWTLCGSHDGRHCDGHWDHLLVLDANGHIRYRTRTHDDIHLYWKGLSPALVFHPRLSSSALNGTFYICHAQKARRLIVNRLGRVRFQALDKDECQTPP